MRVQQLLLLLLPLRASWGLGKAAQQKLAACGQLPHRSLQMKPAHVLRWGWYVHIKHSEEQRQGVSLLPHGHTLNKAALGRLVYSTLQQTCQHAESR